MRKSKKISKKIWLNKYLSKIFSKFSKKLAGKELAIGISIWFVIMSVLMLFANNLNVGNWESEWMEIHAAADSFVLETQPWIWE